MNKRFILFKFFIVYIIIIFIFTSCALKTEKTRLVDGNENYKVFVDDNYIYSYIIYDDENNIVFREYNIEQPVYLSKSNSLITISVDYGSGLQATKFFDMNTKVLSDTFWYVISNNDSFVAYIDGESLDNRIVVIKSIFDENGLNYQKKLDFAKVDTPVENAEFIDDNTIIIEYLNSANEKGTVEICIS